ncbi:MAG: MinD/ParA family protein [Deltaproteobacteria bacterium]|nr:MAG: MinD/ParA family protein [Deltaproteobacteria bacterium]
MTKNAHPLSPSSTPPPDASPRPVETGSVIPMRSARPKVAPNVVAITSGKGGVGKTNVAANLALAYAEHGARVLCIDADLGLANMDIVMGVAPTYTAAELVRGEVAVEDVLLAVHDGVWLLPGASGQYDLANLSDVARRNLFSAVDSLDDRFDVIVVDTGAGVGTNAVGFASAAKDIVVVVTPEPTSVADAYGMIKVLVTRCAVRRVKVITSMVASTAEGDQVFRRLASLVTRFLDASLDHLGSLPRDPALSRSVMRGDPILRAYPDAPYSRAMRAIASRLVQQDDVDDRAGAIRLFWRKLLRQGGRP